MQTNPAIERIILLNGWICLHARIKTSTGPRVCGISAV